VCGRPGAGGVWGVLLGGKAACEDSRAAFDAGCLESPGLSHALGGFVAGAAKGGVAGQEVETAQEIVVEQATFDDLVGDAAYKADLHVAVKGHGAGFDAVAADGNVGADEVEGVDVEAQGFGGKGVPAQQPALKDEDGVGEGVVHVLGAKAGGRAEAKGKAGFEGRRGG